MALTGTLAARNRPTRRIVPSYRRLRLKVPLTAVLLALTSLVLIPPAVAADELGGLVVLPGTAAQVGTDLAVSQGSVPCPAGSTFILGDLRDASGAVRASGEGGIGGEAHLGTGSVYNPYLQQTTPALPAGSYTVSLRCAYPGQALDSWVVTGSYTPAAITLTGQQPRMTASATTVAPGATITMTPVDGCGANGPQVIAGVDIGAAETLPGMTPSITSVNGGGFLGSDHPTDPERREGR